MRSIRQRIHSKRIVDGEVASIERSKNCTESKEDREVACEHEAEVNDADAQTGSTNDWFSADNVASQSRWVCGKCTAHLSYGRERGSVAIAFLAVQANQIAEQVLTEKLH